MSWALHANLYTLHTVVIMQSCKLLLDISLSYSQHVTYILMTETMTSMLAGHSLAR